MKSNLQLFDEFIISLERKWLKIILLLGITLVPLFGLLDILIIPKEKLKLFLSLRFLVSGILMFQLFLISKLQWNKTIKLHAFFFTFLVGSLISFMTIHLGGFESSYYAGLNLVLIAVNFFLPWGALTILYNSTIVLFTYLSMNFAMDTNWELKSLINNMFFMCSTTVIAATIGHYKLKLIRSDFESKENLRLADKVFQNSNEAIMLTNAKNEIIRVNSAFSRVTGYSIKEVIGKQPAFLKSELHDQNFYKKMWATLLEKGEWRGEVWDRRKNGEIYPKWLSISIIKNENKETTHHIAIFTDITTLKQTEKNLERLAHYDSLTNLPNRILFRDRLEQAILHAKLNSEKIALMFIDLDHFKNINDTLGHRAGDELLIEVADRLKKSLFNKEDIAARLSGDEFTLILKNIKNLKYVEYMAKEIQRAFSFPFQLENRKMFVSMSIGIAISPIDGEDVDVLLKNADKAMYSAKESGRNQYKFYSDELNQYSFEYLELEKLLQTSLDQERFFLYYQPKISLKNNQIVGVEALARCYDPEKGIIHPSFFIPIAEETGLIIPLGKQILKMACLQLQRWINKGLLNVRVAVNISSIQFQDVNLIEDIEHILQDTRIAAHFLEFEVTESMIINDLEGTIYILKELKSMGIYISIDDFGTGYSSLNYLKRLPVDAIKIDRSFINNINVNPDDKKITKAIIELAHSLKLKVIAEGVETQEQLKLLKQLGCDEIQGYYISGPVPSEKIESLIARNVGY